ncbi:MAG TPA: carbamoyltransferase C-terminal domain-containing protein [Tepidisphaeraceae bacterium]|jgi:carbamoyltransferase
MLNILGLQFGHDGSAAILRDGKLVCAISRERITRVKKHEGVGKELVDYVLGEAKLKLSDIHLVAFTSFYYRPDNYVKTLDLQGREVNVDFLDLPGGQTIAEAQVLIENLRIPAVFVHHHMCHAASAFYTSPFERAACFTLDASMFRPEACSLCAYGMGNKLHYLYCPGLMVGNAYHEFTEKLGIGSGLTKAGTTMALATYGKPLPAALEKCDEYGQSFYERRFQPSDPLFIAKMWSEISGLPPHESFSREQSDSQRAMDIAASMEHIFQRAIIKNTKKLFEETRHFNDGNLCLSGGSFLNSQANMAIRQETPFKNVHLFPACGDDGTAVGAALYAAHHLKDVPRVKYEPREYMYLGRSYPAPAGGEAYNAREVAQLISEGKIVAWCGGRSEFGPRALGNRSLLVDPRRPDMKEILNKRVKKREWFRPFAPVVLSEKARDWFDLDFESKLMLFICAIKDPEKIPAVAHVDNSARLQTVAREDNPVLHELISEFEKITGVPVLLNTSLNVNNEPLVETPEDAMRFFKNSDVDLLVCEGRVFRK